MATLSVDIHLSKAILTSSIHRNCIIIASTISDYSLRQMLLKVLTDGSTSSHHTASFDRSNCRFDNPFHGILAESNPNMT